MATSAQLNDAIWRLNDLMERRGCIYTYEVNTRNSKTYIDNVTRSTGAHVGSHIAGTKQKAFDYVTAMIQTLLDLSDK